MIPLSIYLDVPEGESANLEVVARASLAFVGMAKEIAFIIDPGLELEIQFKSGTEGSLFLNTLLEDIKDPVKRSKALKAIAIAIIAFFGPDIKSWLIGEGMNSVTSMIGSKEEEGLSEDDRSDIEGMIRRVMNERVAETQRQEFFRELERDPAIKGVGATAQQDERPKHVIPRVEFQRRAGTAVPEVLETTRQRQERMWITLVSPVLTEGRRRWKFRFEDGEHGAYVDDVAFVDRVLRGTSTVPTREGVQFDVTINLNEELRAGIWSLGQGHIITKVHAMRGTSSPDESGSQVPLSFPEQ